MISQASLRTCAMCEFIMYFYAGSTPISPCCGEECGGLELEQASSNQRVEKGSRYVHVRTWCRTNGSSPGPLSMICAEEERSYIRKALVSHILTSDPSERVAVQAALLVANIAQFDFPHPWQDLLAQLINLSGSHGGVPLERRHRALKAIKYTARVLQRKRFVLEEPSGAPLMSLTAQKLNELSANLEVMREEMQKAVQNMIIPLEEIWETEFSAFMQGDQAWRVRMKICRVAMAACREVIPIINNMKSIEEIFQRLMARCCELAGQIAGQIFQQGQGYARKEETEAMCKCWERVLQIGCLSIEKHGVLFAQSLPQWVTLCLNAGILSIDASTVHHIRPKTRVFCVRLLSRAFVNPHFRRNSSLSVSKMMYMSSTEPKLEEDPHIQRAISCLEDILSLENGQCGILVESLATKYIAISPEEKQEWEQDPEGFAREVDMETSPDADTPRPSGIVLLECMLEYSPDNVRKSIMSFAQSIASNPSTLDDAIIAREAVFRIVGECFPHLKHDVSFEQWYTNELRGMIQCTDPVFNSISPFARSMLSSRAIWLVGICAEELPSQAWGEAFGICTHKISDSDVVVALMAVSSVAAMISQAVEEEEFVSQPKETRILLLEGPVPVSNQNSDLIEQSNQECKAHMEAVEANVDALVMHCFKILPNLSEIESMVRVLHCITSVIELMGEKIRGHFQSFIDFLLPLWSMMNTSSASSHALVRLQCSVLAMLAHLVGKLGRAAAEDARVRQVIYPMLISSTDPDNPSSQALAEDALRLWLVMLHTSPELTSEMQDLGPSRLVPHLERGKDMEFSLEIASAYALHGGWNSVKDMSELLASSCHKVIVNAMNYFKQGTKQGNAAAQASHIHSISPVVAREITSALTLLGILQRLHNDVPSYLEEPLKAACALLCMDYRKLSGSQISNGSFIPGRLASLLYPALQIVCRLLYSMPAAFCPMTENDRQAQIRLLDRWMALGSSQDIGEVFIPSLALLGRARRHNAAVAMCMLIMSDQSELLRDGPRVARMIIMALKAALEQQRFERDQTLLFEENEHIKDRNASKDYLRERRLSMMRADPLRTVDAADAFRSAANHVCTWLGKEGLLSILENINPMYATEVSRLLSSQLSETEANEAIERMEKTRI